MARYYPFVIDVCPLVKSVIDDSGSVSLLPQTTVPNKYLDDGNPDSLKTKIRNSLRYPNTNFVKSSVSVNRRFVLILFLLMLILMSHQ